MQHHKQTQDGASYVVASQAKTSQVKSSQSWISKQNRERQVCRQTQNEGS